MVRRFALFAQAILLATLPVLAEEREARPAYDPAKWTVANQPFEIIVDGAGSDEIAVLLDKLDISTLFERTAPDRLRYHGRGPALPSGEHTITVLHIDSSGTWTEIGRFPLRLLTTRGFVSTTFAPTADLTGKGQFGENHAPTANAPERARFQDATAQAGFRTELVRPAFTIRGEAQIAGVTFQNEALRFGSERENAPRVDLAGYRLDVRRGSTVLSAGHLNVGEMRHLISGFQSRGLALTVGEGRPVSLQLAVLNGTSIVGWDNVLGLESASHRVWSATTGFELRRSRPGALHLEVGLFRGSMQPLTNFNEAGVVAAETSRGGALRVRSTTFGGRLRVDAGITRSRFGDAFDSEVESDLEVTAIAERDAGARYADVAADLVQGARLFGTTVTASVRLRHEEVAPQFRTLGASVQANLRTDGADASFTVGQVSGNASHIRTRDNLGNLDSLFTNLTDRSTASLSIPLSSMLQSPRAQRWSPTITLQADAVHQYGDGLPAAGDFTIFDLPDHKSWNAQASADWQIGAWRVGTRLARTEQDNRQPGSETRDFITNTGAFTFDWTPPQRFSLGAEIGLDRNTSEELRKTDSTFRWSATMNWVVYREVTLAGSISNIRAWDDVDARDSRNIDTSVELSTGFRLSRADQRKGRIFIRWVERSGNVHERELGFRDARRNSAFATGLTLRVF